MLRLGSLTVEALHDGAFALDGGAMFGVVPRPLWEKKLRPDARNRVPLALRCLLVRSPGMVALVDTGMGDKWTDKARAVYGVDRSRTLLGELAARGLGPGDVTDVVLTHLHFDHAGGVTSPGEDGRPRLTFPRAVHHVQARNWEWAHAPTERDRGSYLAENFAALREAGAELRLARGAEELAPGVRVFTSEGHTPGMQVVRLEGGGRAAIYPADLIPTAAHLRLAWNMAYDLQPLEVLREKRALLATAADEGATLIFEHDPQLAACTVARDGAEFAVREEIAL